MGALPIPARSNELQQIKHDPLFCWQTRTTCKGSFSTTQRTEMPTYMLGVAKNKFVHILVDSSSNQFYLDLVAGMNQMLISYFLC